MLRLVVVFTAVFLLGITGVKLTDDQISRLREIEHRKAELTFEKWKYQRIVNASEFDFYTMYNLDDFLKLQQVEMEICRLEIEYRNISNSEERQHPKWWFF